MLLAAVLLWAAPAQAEEFTFFEGTQYPLKVHVLKGERDGPTVMIQGGIQGDELAGFVTAQALSHARVLAGTLVVVPRANVPSINVRKRQVNVDLNRRFDKEYIDFYEDRLARAIRFLLARSDALIHLHEGSGFYTPHYVDELRNPNRYGQSIIIDAESFGSIDLGDIARDVIARVNAELDRPEYRFHLFNTKTFSDHTTHAEQRKSLTFYALDRLGIPAMAVEVSKNIRDLEWKVGQQLKTTLYLLERFGVEVEPPDFDFEDYVCATPKVAANGHVIADKKTIVLSPLEPLDVTLAEAHPAGPFDPAPAVFASDRPGVNLVNCPRLALSPFHTMEIRADGERLGEVDVRWIGDWPEVEANAGPVLVCWLNGELRLVPAGGELAAVQGDRLVLEGVWGGGQELLNFKGYVSEPSGPNTGQDLGHEIILDPDNFLSRFLLDSGKKHEWLCEIVRETEGAPETSYYVRIQRRQVQALTLRDAEGQPVVVPWRAGGRHDLPPGEYVLEDVWSNGERENVLVMADDDPVAWGGRLRIESGRITPLSLRQATTFDAMGVMDMDAGGLAQSETDSARATRLQ
jgi:hypothetical protein